ncbi:hypothetical protein BVX99_00355, partial [bacterium F16]
MADNHQQLFTLEFPAGQEYKSRVEIVNSDGYEADDSLVLWTGPRPPVPVGLLLPDRQNAQLERFFLEKALLLKQAGRMAISVRPDGDRLIKNEQLDEVAVIISLDKVPFDSDTLKAWVEKGGRLIYFAGQDSLNSIGNLNIAGLLKSRAVSIHGDRARLESIYIDEVNTVDPLLAPFAKASADLKQFPIFRYVGLQPHASADSLIRLQNKKTLLLRERLGLGDVYVTGIGILPMWSEFPTSRSFVPIIRQLVELPVADRPHGIRSFTCGETLPPDLIAKDGSAELTRQVGISLIDGVPVVVNVDRTESTPETLEVAAITPSEITDFSGDIGTATARSNSVTDLSAYTAVLALLGALLELTADNSRQLNHRQI